MPPLHLIYDHGLSPANPIWAGITHDYPETDWDAIHVHEGVELGITLSGRMDIRFTDSDTIVAARPGDVWLCSIWEPHCARQAGDRNGQVVVIFLPELIGRSAIRDMPWLSLFTAAPKDRPRAASAELRAQIVRIGEELARELEERRSEWQAMVRMSLLRVLILLGRDWEFADRAVLPHEEHADNLSRIAPAIRLVYADPARRVKVQDAAAACGFSPSHFHLIFRQSMGVGFGQFCLRARLAYVARRLLATPLSLQDLAEEAGFVDASHLNRLFVKHFGCTAGEYRKEARTRRPAGPERVLSELSDVPY